MDSFKSIAVPVRKRTAAPTAQRAGHPVPPEDSQVGGHVGPHRRSPSPPAEPVLHRYHVGDRLRLSDGGRRWARAEGICRVTAIMPHEAGPLLYRIRSEVEDFERVVAEEDLAVLT